MQQQMTVMITMSDPFAELNAIVHNQFGAVFTVERTGETVLVCIDESPGRDDYSGMPVNGVDTTGEILPGDYNKVRAGDRITSTTVTYAITEIMPELEGSKDIYLKKVT